MVRAFLRQATAWYITCPTWMVLILSSLKSLLFFCELGRSRANASPSEASRVSPKGSLVELTPLELQEESERPVFISFRA